MNLFAFGLGYCAREIIRRGEDVRASGTLRSPEALAAARDHGIEAHRFDGTEYDDAMLPALCAANLIVVSAPPGALGDPALAIFSDAIAGSRDLNRIVYLSTIGVYGDTGGAWIDENAATDGEAPRALRRLEAEEAWRALGASIGAPVDVLRLAGIYGPGRNSLLKLREGTARQIVKPGQVFNRIHVEDIARIVWRLVAADGPGDIWNVADEEPAPPQDVVAYAAKLLGIEAPPEEDFATALMSPMARSFYEGNRRVRIGKLKRELAYAPIYPTYREGLDALAAAGEGRAV